MVPPLLVSGWLNSIETRNWNMLLTYTGIYTPPLSLTLSLSLSLSILVSSHAFSIFYSNFIEGVDQRWENTKIF